MLLVRGKNCFVSKLGRTCVIICKLYLFGHKINEDHMTLEAPLKFLSEVFVNQSLNPRPSYFKLRKKKI